MKFRPILSIKKLTYKTEYRRLWTREKFQLKKKKAKTWDEAVRQHTDYLKLPHDWFLFIRFWYAYFFELHKHRQAQ